MSFKKIVIVLLISFSILNAFAQSTGTGTIAGKITDQNGEPLSDVYIHLVDQNFVASTDSTGHYKLRRIPEGTYTIIISSIEYVSHKGTITVISSQTTHYSHTLQKDTANYHEITIQAKSEEQTLIESAKSVDVISTKEAKLKSGDLAEVLAQTQGVNIRRDGGLGSNARFSLNGLTDDQIRFFVDGIPIAFTGYSFGIANIPVNLVERVEIYKGVVPVVYGADALGGAVNVVTPTYKDGLHGTASYQVGSFSTHRIAASTQYKAKSGLFFGANGFYDYSLNNYKVTVLIPNAKGSQDEATVERFHDKYIAKGINLDLGIKDKKWADELSFKFFLTNYYKQIQNNNDMSIPYGGVTNGRTTTGVSAHYKKHITQKLFADLIGGYTYASIKYVDTCLSIYNWYGDVVGRRLKGGEIAPATDQTQWEYNYFTRLNLEEHFSNNQLVRLSLAPSLVKRTGKEELLLDPTGVDPLSIKQRMFTMVNGLEYESNFINRKLQNILFIKQYIQSLQAGDYTPAGLYENKDQSHINYGIGNGIRYQFSEQFRAKVSYEYATRLPRTDEVFGDGALLLPNLDLKPEKSNNGNLEFSLSNKKSSASTWTVSVNGFIRATKDLITMLGSDKVFQYYNIASATSKGMEASAMWTSPKKRFSLNANTTWINFINTSTTGAYKNYYGNKIPNRPYLTSNAGAQYNFGDISKDKRQLGLFWTGRFIYQFYQGWESAGINKNIIPSQFVNNVGTTYRIKMHDVITALTFEIQNITNAKLYDNFEVQKPGRAFYLKLICQF